MIYVPRNATNEQVLNIVSGWIDALAREDYESVYSELGYALAFGEPGAECIRNEIKRYRSRDYYPGIEDFTVSNWRTAQGGNPTPKKEVTWYKPNNVGGVGLIGTVQYDLPLNGKWSDLCADFVFFENPNPKEGYALSLEEISSWTQKWREQEERELSEAKPNQNL